jgi:hypothetical protein
LDIISSAALHNFCNAVAMDDEEKIHRIVQPSSKLSLQLFILLFQLLLIIIFAFMKEF